MLRGMTLYAGQGFIFGESMGGVAFYAIGARMESLIAVGLGMAGAAGIEAGCLLILGMGIMAANASLMLGVWMGGL